MDGSVAHLDRAQDSYVRLGASLETENVERLKFEETLTSNVDGNLEPSSIYRKRCRDLTGSI